MTEPIKINPEKVGKLTINGVDVKNVAKLMFDREAEGTPDEKRIARTARLVFDKMKTEGYMDDHIKAHVMRVISTGAHRVKTKKPSQPRVN